MFQIIPEDLYRRLKKHLEYVFTLPAVIANMENMRPLWVAIALLLLNEDTISTFGGAKNLDGYLTERAKLEGKQVHGVERLEEQCSLLNGMDTDMDIFVLNETLSEQERLRKGIVKESTFQKLLDGYRQGNIDPKLLSPISLSTKNASSGLALKIEEYFQTNLIEKRNKKMAARIIDLLKENPDAYFFAFGLSHFIGEDNIPDMIRSAGFQVEEVYEQVTPSATADGVFPKPKPTSIMIFCLIVGLTSAFQY